MLLFESITDIKPDVINSTYIDARTLQTFATPEIPIQLFCIDKIAIIASIYYAHYSSSIFKNSLLRSFFLQYDEVTLLHSTIIDNIFNESFLQRGLESNYPDFFIIFDIFLKYELLMRDALNKTTYKESETHGLSAIKKVIQDAQASTLKILNIPHRSILDAYKVFDQSVSSKPNYKRYIEQRDALIHNLSTDDINGFLGIICFDKLKQVLDLNIDNYLRTAHLLQKT